MPRVGGGGGGGGGPGAVSAARRLLMTSTYLVRQERADPNLVIPAAGQELRPTLLAVQRVPEGGGVRTDDHPRAQTVHAVLAADRRAKIGERRRERPVGDGRARVGPRGDVHPVTERRISRRICARRTPRFGWIGQAGQQCVGCCSGAAGGGWVAAGLARQRVAESIDRLLAVDHDREDAGAGVRDRTTCGLVLVEA